jgi:hypothetical protein
MEKQMKHAIELMDKQMAARKTKQITTVPVRTEPMTPMELLSRAVQEGAGIETLKELTLLVRDWKRDAARDAFNTAIADAKASLPVIAKTRHVKFPSKKEGSSGTDYWYEDLSTIARTIDPILSKCGLGYRFRTESSPNEPVKVTCVLFHRQGHSEENWLSAGRDDTGNKNSNQALGSTVTYLQRYTLKAALGLAAARDDDARATTPIERISVDQCNELQALIKATALTDEQFCLAYQIGEVSELPVQTFNAALARLKTRQKTIAEKGTKQ